MAKAQHDPSIAHSERRFPSAEGPSLAGVQVRDGDMEPAKGLHSVAKLFRTMAGLLLFVMALQVVNGITGTIEISYGVLFAEAVRLVIFAGLLWGAGDLADLFVKSHHDLRATRILLGRIAHLVGQQQPPSFGESRPGDTGPGRGRGDATH